MKIGVFDSGIGGQSVADAIKEAEPDYEIIFVQDKENVPYGNKTPEELLQLTIPIMEGLVQQHCDVIVVACNTVTTTIIGQLREHFADTPFIGIEPMVKPAAALTKSGVIAVCATPTTLASKRYEYLIETYAAHLEVLEPDCSQWAYMIENNAVDNRRIEDQITEVCRRGADVIVLGCTHYHWIEEEIKAITERYGAQVLQPEQAIVQRLRQVIARLG